MRWYDRMANFLPSPSSIRSNKECRKGKFFLRYSVPRTRRIMLRCINGAFSMTSLIQYEPSVDRIIRAFLSQTERLYASTPGKSGNECDFAKWLQYYAFDVIGAITYSKAHGFVDRNEDVDGMVKYLAGFFDYIAVVRWRVLESE